MNDVLTFALTTAAFVYHAKWTRWKRWFDEEECMVDTSHPTHTRHTHHTHHSSPIVTTDDPTITHVIEFQIGAGMWAYYCGVSRHLAETMDLSRCVFVGYSAGIMPMGGLAANLCVDEPNFRETYLTRYNDLVKDRVMGNVWNTTKMATKSVELNCEYHQKTVECIHHRMFSGVSEIVPSTIVPYGFALRPRYLSGAVDMETHCKVYTAPFTIPGFTKLGLYTEIDGRMYVDHGFITKRGSCVAVNRVTNKPLEKINIWATKWRKHPLQDYWLTTDEDRIWRLYRMGYADARANM
jgi:hypothetical protein